MNAELPVNIGIWNTFWHTTFQWQDQVTITINKFSYEYSCEQTTSLFTTRNFSTVS